MEKLYEKRKDNYQLRIFQDKPVKELVLIVDTKKQTREIEAALSEKCGVVWTGEHKAEHKTEYAKTGVTFNLSLGKPEENQFIESKRATRIEARAPYESFRQEDGDEKYEPMLYYFSRHIQPALGTSPARTIYIVDLGFGAGRVNRFVFTGTFDTAIAKNPTEIRVGAGLILSGGACRDWGCRGDLKCFMEKAGTELRQKVLEYAEKGRPVLGICMGHLLLNYFFGGGFKAPREEEFEERDCVRYTKKALALMRGIPDGTKMQYYHRGEITRVSTELDVAGFSHHLQPENMFPQGGPAIFVHKEKPVYSVFFHPEYSGDKTAFAFYGNFLKICEELN